MKLNTFIVNIYPSVAQILLDFISVFTPSRQRTCSLMARVFGWHLPGPEFDSRWERISPWVKKPPRLSSFPKAQAKARPKLWLRSSRVLP
jgi:hypothetical protein